MCLGVLSFLFCSHQLMRLVVHVAPPTFFFNTYELFYVALDNSVFFSKIQNTQPPCKLYYLKSSLWRIKPTRNWELLHLQIIQMRIHQVWSNRTQSTSSHYDQAARAANFVFFVFHAHQCTHAFLHTGTHVNNLVAAPHHTETIVYSALYDGRKKSNF